MAKTYRNRKNIWEDGAKTKSKKSLAGPSKKKKYTTNEILEFNELDYEHIR